MTNDECPNCGPDCATTRGHHHTLELAPGNDDCCPCCAYLPKVMTPAVLVNGVTNYRITGNGTGIHWPDVDEDLSIDACIADGTWVHREALKRYQEETRRLYTDRAAGQGLPLDEESRRASALVDIWQQLNAEEQEAIEAWVERLKNGEPLCNLCGLSCCLTDRVDHDDYGNISHDRFVGGMIGASVSGGFESTPGNGFGALDDTERYRFNLCEFCCDWLFTRFIISVAVDNYMNDMCLQEGETFDEAMDKRGCVKLLRSPDPSPWRPAARRVAEDVWRTMKDEYRAEAARRDEARRAR